MREKDLKDIEILENLLKKRKYKMYTEFYTSNIGVFKRLLKCSVGGNAWISF